MAWQAVTPRVEEEVPAVGRGPTPPWRRPVAGMLAVLVLAGLVLALWPRKRPPAVAKPETGMARETTRAQQAERTGDTRDLEAIESGGPTGTKPVRRIRIAPDRSKVRLLEDILDVGGSQTVDDMWSRYQALGMDIERGILDDYLREAKAYQLDLTKTAGGWDRLLQFWATRDPDTALRWAENAGLLDVDGAPDEIVYRMIRSWGQRDPEAALAYARNLGLGDKARGVETLSDLEGVLARDHGAIGQLESLLALPPEDQMRAMGSGMNLMGGLSGKAAADLAEWLATNQSALDPSVLSGMVPGLLRSLDSLPAADRAAFVDHLLALPMNQSALSNFLPALARVDVDRALAVVGELPESYQGFATTRILDAWTIADPDAAVAYVRAIEDPAQRAQALYALFGGLGAAYSPPFQGTSPTAIPRETLDWLGGLLAENPSLQARHARAYAQLLVGSDPLAAMALADASPDNVRETLRLGVIEQWARRDLGAAIAWLNQQQDGRMRQQGYDQVLPLLARQDPDAAMAWLNTVENPAAWEKAAERLFGATPVERLGPILRQLTGSPLSPSQQALVASKAFSLGFNRSGEAAQVIDLLLEKQNVPRVGGLIDPEAWKQLDPQVVGAMERGFGELTRSIAAQSPEQGLRLAESFAHLPLDKSKWAELSWAYIRWYQLTPQAATDWLEHSALDDSQRRALTP
jgi:hypothetical protein